MLQAMVNEISSSITGTGHTVYLLYNKQEYNLMMADIEAETCSCWQQVYHR